MVGTAQARLCPPYASRPLPVMLAIFGRRDVHVPAKDPVEMALIGKAAQKRDFLERQAIFPQMLARTFHLSLQDIGMRPGRVMRLEFACKLHRRAVAYIGQFLERDVTEDVVFDVVLDQPRMGRPETSLRARQLELDGGVFSQDVHAGLKRQRIITEPPARTSSGHFLNHLIADPGQYRIFRAHQIMEFNALRVAVESLACRLHHERGRDIEMRHFDIVSPDPVRRLRAR